MGIRRLEISGFRSLADVKWEPGPLNLVIGVNGSGKSNLLQALMLLRAAAEGKLSETVRRMGGMVPLLWDGQTTKIQLRLKSDLSSPSNQAAWLYKIAIAQEAATGAFRIDEEQLGIVDQQDDAKKKPIYEWDGWVIDFFGRDSDGQTPVTIDIETAHEAVLSQLPNRTPLLFRKLLSQFSLYHNIRVDAASEIRRATVTRLEQQVEEDGGNLIAVLHSLYENERAFQHSLNNAMRAAFGDEFEELLFPPAEDGRVQLRLRWRSLKRAQSAADLSDGTLRFLFLITVLANPNPPSLIAIDEPETGLHPSMFPIVAEYAIEALKRTQVIFTTHSPQFLNAFTAYPDITTVAELHEGKTVLRRLPADKLAKWLEHYQLGELMMSGELETMD